MLLVIFLVAATLFRIMIGRYFPIIGDESFYWLWSKHLDLSYVDHPPMIAYYIKSLTLIFGNTEMAIRLGAVILVALITLVIYKIGQELFDRKTGLISAIIFNITPAFFGGGIFLVPQQPFLLFWAISIYVFVRLIKSGKYYWWYLLGISVGLGLLSDYIMFLFFPVVGLYLVLNKNLRHWWGKKETYLGAIISFLFFSPVIVWNLRHGFTPLFYWTARSATAPNHLENVLTFLVLENVLYTPILFLLVFFLIARILKNGNENRTLLGCLSAPVMLAFLLLSPLMNVGGHWPAAAYLPAILFLGQIKKKWLIGLTIFFAILINCLAFTYYLFLYPTPQELVGKEFTINQELPDFLRASKPKIVLANNLGLAGLVAFHGKTKVHMAPGRLKQFDIWGEPKLKKGNNLLYFVLNESEVHEELIPLFKKVKREPQKRIFTKDADIPNKTEIYHCFEYQGGTLP